MVVELLALPPQGVTDVYCEESDSEVFEGSSTEHVYARTNSSSSSRKSSYEDTMDDKTPLPLDHHRELSPAGETPSPAKPPTVVEWKPQGVRQHDPILDSPRMRGGKDSGSEGLESPPGEDLKAIYGSTVTVTIDPPQDNGGGVDAEVSDYLDGSRVQEAKTRNLADMFGRQDKEEVNSDLFESLNESDLEEDDSEPAPPTKICLMSK